jgi:hypothetical protein
MQTQSRKKKHPMTDIEERVVALEAAMEAPVKRLSRVLDSSGTPVYIDSSRILIIQQLPEESNTNPDHAPVSRVMIDGSPVGVDLLGTPDEVWGYEGDTLGTDSNGYPADLGYDES